jgi:broad specificity phosphatase PhoE
MTVTTRWWWIRHAPVRTETGWLYGQRDVTCDTSDRASFRALAALLPERAVWISSPLKRARQTAEAMAEALGERGPSPPAPAIEPAFIEQDFGKWQGLSYAEIEASLGAARPKFWFAPAYFLPPGGESFAAVAERAAGAIRRLTEAHAGRDIVAFGHGGGVRAALALALDLDPELALRFAVDTLTLTRIDHLDGPDGAWRVVAVNQPAPPAA